MHQRAHNAPVTRGFRCNASGCLHWKVQSVEGNHLRGGSENCLISHQCPGRQLKPPASATPRQPHLMSCLLQLGAQMPITGCWQEQKACELHGSKLYMTLRGGFRTPVLGVRADSCSLSFWNNQLKLVVFFFFFCFQSRKTYGISFPWDT